MTMNDEQVRHRLERLLFEQPLGVLATSAEETVHASLVAFAATGDLMEIVFATDRGTRKYELLQSNPRAALLVDDRCNEVCDFQDACAVTARGTAGEVEEDRREELRKLFLDEHPHLNEFVSEPSCALMRLAVEAYDLVGNFQEVHELRIGNEPEPNG